MLSWSKTFILLSGILYAFVGVYCFFQPIGALIGLAWSIGFLVLTSGIFGVIAYIQLPKEERVIWGLLVCLTDIIFGMTISSFSNASYRSCSVSFSLRFRRPPRWLWSISSARAVSLPVLAKFLCGMICAAYKPVVYFFRLS